jgi:hypothetical protein
LNKAWLPHSGEPFVRVPLAWLLPSKTEGRFPAAHRFYVLLWYRSREGTKPVRIGLGAAAEAGLCDRSNRRRVLTQLEKWRLVTIHREGNKALTVTVHPMAAGKRPIPDAWLW